MAEKIPSIISGGLFLMAFLMAAVTTASEIQQNGITSDAFFTGSVTVAVGILALIGALISVLAQNSRLKKLIYDDKKNDNSLYRQIGVATGKDSLSEQLGTTKFSITEQLGIENAECKSISAQNNELLKEVKSYREDEAKKLKNFSKKQKDIAKTVDDVNCFLKDWEQKTISEQNLKTELTELKASLEKSAAQISLLQADVSKLTAENEALKHNNALLSSALQQSQSESSDEQDYER